MGTPHTLDTPEAVVLDGANGVTHDPREHFPRAGLSLGLEAVALVAAVVLLRSRRAPLAAVLLAGAAVPGLYAVLVERADAPPQRHRTAAAIHAAEQELQAHAPWPQPVVVRHEDDDVLFPLTRYAVPTRPPEQPGAVQLEVRGSSLQVRCEDDVAQGRIVCGGAP